jgi:hypothetical protein
MGDVTKIKEIGFVTGLLVMDCKSFNEYPSNHTGASANFGSGSDEIVIHLSGSPDTTEANNILTAIDLPTCTSSGLDITVNCGTYLVDDETSITADPSETKYVKVVICIDDASGDIETCVFTKTTGEYGSVPAGKTLCADMKEYSVPASGTTLTELNDWIR